jgi:hypothetical protein
MQCPREMKRMRASGAKLRTGIESRNPARYDEATGLLSDLQALAVEEGSQGDFNSRVGSIALKPRPTQPWGANKIHEAVARCYAFFGQ